MTISLNARALFGLCAIHGIFQYTMGFTSSSKAFTFTSSNQLSTNTFSQMMDPSNHKSILSSTSSSTSTSLSASKKKTNLEKGDRVLLIGPGFLQLNIAKAAKAAGLIPMIIAPQKKLDKFADFVNDDEIMNEANIGLPDELNTVEGVVFCSEEAVFGASLVQTVLDSSNVYVNGKDGPTRTIACVPISNAVNKVKSMGWMPIFNNDSKQQTMWNDFVSSFQTHPISSGSAGNVIRYGNLLGGSIDGPLSLKDLGLDECIYKMSLENYRDLRERSYDRYRLGAQIIPGDAINPRPSDQDKNEKEYIQNAETIESYRILNGYPEVDSVCRHIVAQAVVQSLMRPTRGEFTMTDNNDKSVPKEFTVLSKCLGDLPTDEEWDELFLNPGQAPWPDPSEFDPSMIPKIDEVEA